jgi:hypothetical protein
VIIGFIGFVLRRDRNLDLAFQSISIESGADADSAVVPRLVLDLSGKAVDTLGHRTMWFSVDDISSVRIGDISVMLPTVPVMPRRVELQNSTVTLDTAASGSARWGEFRVTGESFDGDTTFALRFLHERRRYDAAFLDSMADDFARNYRASQPLPTDALAQAVRENVVLPPTMTPIQAASVLNDDWLLLERDGSGSSVRVLLIDPGGRQPATVNLPTGVRLLWVSPARIWAVHTDSLEIPWLVRYRVTERR